MPRANSCNGSPCVRTCGGVAGWAGRRPADARRRCRAWPVPVAAVKGRLAISAFVLRRTRTGRMAPRAGRHRLHSRRHGVAGVSEACLAVLMPANPPGRPRGRPGNLTVNWQVSMPENLTACPRRRGPPTRRAERRSRSGNLTVNWQVSMPENLTACPRRRGPPRRPAERRSRPGNVTVNWQVSMPENLTACHSRRRAPCATSAPRTPDPADKQALRERMDRLENRGARVSRRALIAEVRREQTEPADPPRIDGRREPVADTRPLPVVHHADLDEHPLDTGSVDAGGLDSRPRSGAARSRATDSAIARGGGQWRCRSCAARRRAVRSVLTWSVQPHSSPDSRYACMWGSPIKDRTLPGSSIQRNPHHHPAGHHGGGNRARPAPSTHPGRPRRSLRSRSFLFFMTAGFAGAGR